MRPYRSPLPRPAGNLLCLLFLITVLSVNLRAAGLSPDKADFETLTRSGFQHFYSLEYDDAIRDFQKAAELRPDDPAATNHLLDAYLYRDLNRYDALDTRLYIKQGFMNSKQVPMDAAAKKQLRDLMDKAINLSDKRLKADPRDARALYDRGVTEGLRATYMTIVEHSWFGALRSALAARHDHEDVMKMHPDWVDARTVVGAHLYVVGSLTMPAKAMAGIAGIHGDKKRGLQMLDEAGKARGETSEDARVAEALFLRREGDFDHGLEVVRSLTKDHPRNFLFALEEGNLLQNSHRNSEAITSLKTLLAGCKEGKYPNAHTELAYLTLGDAQRELNQLQEALAAYKAAADAAAGVPDYKQKALLAAGEVSDMLSRREEAMLDYRAVIAMDGSSEEAGTARKHLDKPYRGR